ncbi:Na+/H+ antiporter NhaC family protein [Bacillus thermotolerans]|uniref:Na+/H+ antiporter n=1 Tax=Bacillus thermotolerans TaxID=1221996 RepID=A0A0F5I9L3_BACTR|nr:Na+/H+ antiporter NhaC family protein [Bacillus thermotolerans]KKB41872.1 Na+/H+ antiporter [Bacillus thermotolerans]
MENTIFSLLPPVIAILMVVLTRRVLLSLGVGIVAAAFLLAEFNLAETALITWNAAIGNIYADGEWSTWNIFIILFLLLLGIITAFINISGGSRAFGEWAVKRVKTRAGAQIMAALLGILIFIDDYFNALAVGQISRPVTDRQRISRAKLAYIIDSTSAPVCVVSPISSWGAYIIGVLGTILAAHGITEYTAFSAFVQTIPMNFYAWTALLLVFLSAWLKIDFGPMKQHENRAITLGEVMPPDREAPGELKEDLPVSSKGKVGDLVWPIVALIIGTVSAMLWTGAQATEGTVTILTIFENTDVAKSLLYGGLVGVIVAIAMFLRQSVVLKGVETNVFGTGVWEGIKSMLPAVYILFFAWTIVTLIGDLGTGTYLAGLVEQSNMNVGLLPFLLFVIAGIMAFATGTSWGSFGILLPIAGEITAVTDVSLMIPALAAVLAGAVFGDHCSPISDTTILSSTGAGSHHIDHVLTQIPYAALAAIASSAGFLVLGFTNNAWLSLAVSIVAIVLLAVLLKGKKDTSSAEA